MAAYLFKIGTLQFSDLRDAQTGNGPRVPEERVEKISRPGVEGVGIRKLGKAGHEFKMLGTADVATGNLAAILKDTTYPAMKGSQLYDIIWKGVSWNAQYGVKFWVIDVTSRYRSASQVIGGLRTAGPGWVVESEWLLLPYEV